MSTDKRRASGETLRTVQVLIIPLLLSLISLPLIGSHENACSICPNPGFTLVSNPSSISVPPTQSQTVSISGRSILGWSGTVSLAVSISSGAANNLAGSFGSSTICVSSGVSLCSSSALTIAAQEPGTPNGDYSATVTGTQVCFNCTSAPLSYQLTIPIHVLTPFTIVPNPTSLAPLSGSSQNSTLVFQSLYSWSGTIALTTTVTPQSSTASISPQTISLGAGGSATSVLTFGPANLGNYSVTVIGTSGSIIGRVTLLANATDFKVITSSDPWIAQSGSMFNTTITLTGLNGFKGPVNLSAQISPLGAGSRATFSNQIVTLNSAAKITSTLSLSSGTSGTYTVNVTATSGTLTHSVLRSVTFNPEPSAVQPTILGFQPLEFYGIAGGAVAAIAVGAAVGMSRKRGSKPPAMAQKSVSPEKGPLPEGRAPGDAGSASPASELSVGSEAPKPKSRIGKIFPTKLPGIKLPTPISEHKVPIALVSLGTGLVVAALATISPQAGLFGGLFIPGILLLGVGGVVLFLQLYRRPVGLRRFCMNCGFQMLTTDYVCSRCHKQPPSGVDTRVCPNCDTVIPTLAKFCKTCGAGQPSS